MSPHSLLLPIETLNREFDAKLLLALHAAERGWEASIGKKSTLNDQAWRFGRSIYFSKDFRAGNGKMFRILSELGHAIVGLDEEGLVNATDEMFLMKIDPELVRHMRVAFAWGENDARIYRKVAESVGRPIVVTGNPRIDLLRPELAGYFAPEAESIRKRFGRFVLFNTNFAMVNHFIADYTRFKVADWVPENKAAEMKSGFVAHKARLFEAFRELIPRLAAAVYPRALVIRPHPSENHETWAEAAAESENVHVIHEGTVVPWLYAADVLLHNGCTSAVEAAIVGTPALCYRPVKDPEYDNALPNGVSQEFETADTLIAAARNQLNQNREGRQELDPGRRAFLDGHIAALDGPLASARLTDELARCFDIMGPPPTMGRRIIGMTRLAGRRVSRSVRKGSINAKGNPFYLRHKFRGISLEEVNGRIGRLAAALGRFDGYAAEEILPDLFRIVSRPA